MKRAVAVLLSMVLLLSACPADAAAISTDVSADLSGFPALDTTPGADAADMAAGADAAGTVPVSAGMSNFQRTNFYIDGQFEDVGSEDWFRTDVGTVYELGLMEGMSDARFDPTGQVTVAQAIVMAVRLHRIYNTGSG